MKLFEHKNYRDAQENRDNLLDPEEVQKSLKNAFGEEMHIEINGIIRLPLSIQIDMEIDPVAMRCNVSGIINLNSHEPRLGEPDFDHYIAQISLLPKLSAILVQHGFSPVEWGVSEYSGPGNGMCSVLMAKQMQIPSVEAFVREVSLIRKKVRELDS